MPARYENIPPEQELAYLETASRVVEQATEPVIHDAAKGLYMGSVLMNMMDANGSKFADKVEQYAHDNDYRLDEFSTGIGDAVEAELRWGEIGKQIATTSPKAEDYRKMMKPEYGLSEEFKQKIQDLNSGNEPPAPTE